MILTEIPFAARLVIEEATGRWLLEIDGANELAGRFILGMTSPLQVERCGALLEVSAATPAAERERQLHRDMVAAGLWNPAAPAPALSREQLEALADLLDSYMGDTRCYYRAIAAGVTVDLRQIRHTLRRALDAAAEEPKS